MDFKCSEIWGKEILNLTNLYVQTDKESDRFEELLDMAEHPKDIKATKALMRCLLNDDMGGIQETFYGNLSTADYRLYYTVLFELTPDFIQTEKGKSLVLYMLQNYSGQEYTKEEWKTIFDLVKTLLSKKEIQELLIGYKDEQYYNEDYPYPQFQKIFETLLKEKNNE